MPLQMANLPAIIMATRITTTCQEDSQVVGSMSNPMVTKNRATKASRSGKVCFSSL